MGIFKKVKNAVSSSANDALDSIIDPAKELDMKIEALDTQRGLALKELLSYKTSAKQMENSAEEQKLAAQSWEKKAMIAVKSGDDELAKGCLTRKKECLAQFQSIRRDQLEAAGYAAELNESRKGLETKLKILKMRKGTLATQIAAARSGEGNVLGQSNELFDKLDEAERKIDDELFAQEAATELSGAGLAGASADDLALETEILRVSQSPEAKQLTASAGEENDPLALLKAKMKAKKE